MKMIIICIIFIYNTLNRENPSLCVYFPIKDCGVVVINFDHERKMNDLILKHTCCAPHR